MTNEELNYGIHNTVIICLEVWDGRLWRRFLEIFKSVEDAEKYWECTSRKSNNIPHRIIRIENKTEIAKHYNIKIEE